MKNIKIATAQFENKGGDKSYNLGIIRTMSQKAARAGADVISFHECSITGYSFARKLSREQLFAVAEDVSGESVNELKKISTEYGIVILAGLFEKDKEGNIYNTYVCVNGNELVASYRKLHPFINPSLSAGNTYVVFDLMGWKCCILICYDNNIIENVRATSLLGADIIFMPHVTMCTPSPMPGRGFVDSKLWDNRETDPVPLRMEFDGPKGRGWLMRWLPARAYDNGVYIIFSNPVGMDDDQLKNGNSLVLDPYGEIIAECRTLGDDFVVGVCTPDKIKLAGGTRYKKARRPELYKGIIGATHNSEQKVVWLKA